MTETELQHSEQIRKVFFVSDRTGLTAESYGKCLLAQFPDLEFETITLAFVDTPEKALQAREKINETSLESNLKPVVFSTLVHDDEQYIIESANACVISLFHSYIGSLESFFGVESSHKQGVSRIAFSDTTYQRRLDAIDFALSHDDGVRPDHYNDADVILAGVSRCGKTPTSLYLAMNFSLKVANYPLTPEDLSSDELPQCLLDNIDKLVGLTIKPVPLSRIRRQRRPGSEYASLEICQAELTQAQAMFDKAGIAVFETTDTSIEEISSRVVRALGLGRERVRESVLMFNKSIKAR
ncbi:putative phosphoenolpyruvate synthase regulatory protein [Methylophaga thalassica]|uniref:Putative phosphoenolpyruvate synthase regulatory protein n=1 Tax=Methylophaga thalassica TaxID=40223 RepID=A0ABQ5TQW4_9GAMM|nr:pyruvate, water dikinase regulatory protein [Methylophaga thalassica]GLP98654.1 putative phosphoenolpyruvate synthase regulatory protein [Methylophaga thalassica]